jgi:molybdopterin synthase catalytic subunit
MAETKMKQVADEIRNCWNCVGGIAVVRRSDRLYPQTPAVLIACIAAHRATGVFEATLQSINRIKEIFAASKTEAGPNDRDWVDGN